MIKRFFAVVWGLAVLTAAAAQAEDGRYEVEVAVDVTDQNASLARERAMAEANRSALMEVANRVTTSEGAAVLTQLNDNQLLNFIKEVAVVSEKASGVRYLATLRIKFNEGILKQYLSEKGMPILVMNTSRVLILPVFRDSSAGQPQLWEDTNVWKKVWEEKAPRNRSVKYAVAEANGTNDAVIDAERALSLDGVALDKLYRLNGVDDIYIVEGYYDGVDGAVVNMHSYKSGSNAFEKIRVPGDRDSGEALWEKAMSLVTAKIENRLKQQSVMESSVESSAAVMYSFDSMSDWLATERRLKDIAAVKEVTIEALGSGRVQFRLVYRGSDEKLLQGLRSKNFDLINHGNFFILEKY